MAIWLETIQHLVWGRGLCLLLLGVGICYTIATGVLPLHPLGLWLKETIGSLAAATKSSKDRLSPFEAMSTALGATMGTGNLVGVAAALATGGPGAVFWMWVSAFFGMALKYGEIFLSLRYRFMNPRRGLVAGPMAYIERGLGSRPFAAVYGFLCLLGCFGMGNLSQANAMAQGLWAAWKIPPLYSGLAAAVLVGLVAAGGLRMLGKVTGFVVPLLTLAYLGAGFIVLYVNRSALPGILAAIFQEAFSLPAAAGGTAGYGIRQAMASGFSKGVFSHEAGLGSSSLAHGAADAQEPAKQAMWGIFEVFVDTMVVCTMTALVILASGVSLSAEGARSAMAAFATVFGDGASGVLAAALALFAFATLIGWRYYGESCVRYLWGNRAVWIYGVLFLGAVVVGAVTGAKEIWNLADSVNGLMAFPNLTALVFLLPQVARGTKEYLKKEKKKTEKKS